MRKLILLLFVVLFILACNAEKAAWDAVEFVDGGIPPTATPWSANE
jgi:hypothetical protein